jgi:ferredoxin
VFGVVLAAPWPPYWDYNNVYYQNLELPNGGQCISCGNCSTYCEMGIDVRSYAEKEKTLFVPPVWYLCGCLPRGIEMKMTHRQADQFERNFTRNDVNLMDLLNNK